MTFTQRRLFSTLVGITLALALVVMLNLSVWPQVRASSALPAIPSQHCNPNACNGTFYGTQNFVWMLTATSDWYQQGDFWCGVANVRAIQRYDWLRYNNGNPGWDNSQTAIYNTVNSSAAVSPWGYGGGYVKGDISKDTGTDPRAIAYSAWDETPTGYYFHNYIYMGVSNTTATYDVAYDFGNNSNNNDPNSITIDQGGHSFIVDGVYATGDPSYGNAILNGIDTWDLWLNSSDQGRHGYKLFNSYQNQVWTMYDWLTQSWLWGKPYNNINNNDPDPTAPNHYYNPPFPGGYNHHWIGYYVTIEQDFVTSSTHDYALDQNFNLVPHN